MTQRLEGKVAIITGAGCVGPGWGNGRSMAYRFIEEGAHVFAVDIDESALTETIEKCEGLGGQLITHICDATRSNAVLKMVDTCVESFGRLDILVNNVGGSRRGGPVQLSEEDWDSQIDYNLKTVFLGCKNALPHMERLGGGSIINIASTSGIRWSGSAQVAYAATKAGVIQLSRVVAVEYAAKRIRVNSILPGQLHTPMVEARLAGQRTGGDVDMLLKQRQARIPLGFMGDGRDTANAAVFLASEEARFITGTEIIVDGGMTARCD
ncbi:MAG: 3-oxoacyl-ACP reductase [Rhodospirillaceae bacterium]|nr:3-oxoacyl-ACP reductase [Rhodospirillaceae bacterium]